MDAILMLLTAVVGWIFCVFVTINARSDERERNTQHAAELARRDDQLDQLLHQVQLNAQNMPYYPQIGPFPAADTGPEPRYLSSDDGLIVFEDYEIDAVDEVVR